MTSPRPLPTNDQSEALSDLMWMSLDVTPLDLLMLATTKSKDPDEAMRIAEASAPKTAEAAE